jgi:tetratricopeptide (TPR) repeat protein
MSDASAAEAVLFAALEKPTPAERNAFLDSACAGDAELRRQVERLLKAHAHAGAFLQKPVVEQLAVSPEHPDQSNVTTDHSSGAASGEESHPAADAPGGGLPVVPGYRVLREIARGGMGRVLAARDHNLDRDVALKILLPGANAERFVRESKITARLPHPGIPPVHALGTLADGSPFLAMKLVAGQTLTEQMKTGARPRLLQAFTQVCQAVGFAHSRGIVHRDLKPANVMVGAFGEVQVMDWGLAKDLTAHDVGTSGSLVTSEPTCEPHVATGADANQTTDHHWPGESTDDQTQAGQVMGTPAYMAPEQARGEATDARADVFALGGMLCAILTGQPPFTGKSSLEVIHRARAADLAEAHVRLDGCGADAELVALCRRCLSADPADRPADGQAVADELTTYLNGVQERLQAAQRERAVALAREAEQRKRRKVYLALAATILVAVLGGTAGAGIYLMQAQQVARDKAVAAATEQGRLARNGDEVRRLLDETTKALEAGDAARAEQLLAAAGERMNDGGADESSARLERLQEDLAVLIALDRVDEFRWTVVDNKLPGPPAVAAQLRKVLARFGLRPESVSAQEASARVSGSAVRDRLVAALDRWLLVDRLPWVRAVLQRADPDAFRDLFRDAFLARDGAKQLELAGRKQAGEQPPGFVAFLGDSVTLPVERRRELLTAAVRQRPDDLGLLMALGMTYPQLERDSTEERLRWFQAAVGAAPRNGAAHNSLGVALSHAGRKDDAIGCFEKATKLDPKNALAHVNLGQSLSLKSEFDQAVVSCRKAVELAPTNPVAHASLGKALHGKGQVDAAIASFKEAIKLDRKCTLAHLGLGELQENRGQVDAAIASYRKAIEFDPKLVYAYGVLAGVLVSRGQVDEAIAHCRTAVNLAPKLALAHASLGTALRHKGKLAEAIACFEKAIDLDPMDANARQELAIIHYNNGNGYRSGGKGDEAIASYKKAIAADPEYADAYGAMGKAQQDKGQIDDAIASYKKAIACFEKSSKPGPNYADVHTDLGVLLAGKRQLGAAMANFRKAVQVGPKNARAHQNLGTALVITGQMDEAIASFRETVKLDSGNIGAHTALGGLLFYKGQLDEAIASSRRAIELYPKNAEALCNLGRALSSQGRFADALDALRRGHELGTKQPGWRYPSADWLRQAERMAALEARLPAFLKGEHKPHDTAERLDLASVCAAKRLHHTAARLYAEAFAADPKLAEDLKFGHRYNAACAAALAAAGKGEDAGKRDDKERARLRKQALDWFRADLALYTKQLQSHRPDYRAFSQQALTHWQEDRDLAGVRDKDALAKLPAEERAAWEKLWANVAALLKKSATAAPKEGRR